MTDDELRGWVRVSSGKVRDIYAPADQDAPDRLLLVTSDRISAFDCILPTPIPGKGKILNQLAIWWMDRLRDIVENHLLATAHDPLDPYSVPEGVEGRAVVAKALRMIPIECVVRGYLTGSGLVEYEKSGTVCGIGLPEGLAEASRLDTPIFTPAAKAELGEHDENITFERAADMVGAELAARLRDTSIALYERARDIAAARGVIIADTKFEFGLDPATGALVLGDEILTPDSSRFWPADEWTPGRPTPSFDKQYLRDWLTSAASGWDRASGAQPPALPDEVAAATGARYVEAFTRLTGEEPKL
ncbi:MAG: phosphoribosylaminoimidazolesuccinocarboxamide synthase [Schaalia hyovaginalis]|uniref:phosphoribosylaminoimidazolesuccinocarboxamide synthase n=1 Tax=Schaalia hyovaginalis TaxID=29316 RepID=UPI0026EE6ACB|nr:phosphoribosylaminoimidazolesuccinocarboxamide synthase [Schaalia hyovaginalis]MCI6410493.1 phosphoribosylaminoimidazolesuccinocarboxamide synthase [Schaalia hyovaginalis]MDY3664746.1 phosphoribosylaminoimidazolesuccinocarboxamide synthase [Schaalia hyovaginalis]MDY4262984.1 phosphoribosylaminoimidazolesuccinocarboxamide synthase [Schaalia hyovaginalis]MDY4492102.1 phosphoribosylaminoimidazolesuccinocarboxamide synthase [Schaalia hyovaginalis]MDY5601300.1 phosphoribosylaminoimidazolesuccino